MRKIVKRYLMWNRKAARRKAAAFSACLLTITSSLPFARANQPQLISTAVKPVTFNRKECTNFLYIVHALFQKGKICLIIEGQPTQQKSSETLVADLTKSQPLMLEDAIAKVSDEYDYSPIRRNKVVILSKRYSNSDVQPNVTLGECALCLQNVLKAYASFVPMNEGMPDKARQSTQTSLLDSILDDQWKLMATPKGLATDRMNPDQPNLLSQYFTAAHFEYELLSVHRYAIKATGTKTKPTAFYNLDGKKYAPDLAGEMVFGCDFSSIAGILSFVPLSHPNKLFVQYNSVATFSISDKRLTAKFDGPDPTIPTEEDKRQEPLPSPDTKTIGEIIEQLNKEEGNPNPARYQVHEAYAAKTVTIIGGETLTPEETLRAIADIYGMRLVHTNDGLALRPPALRLARNLAELPGTVAEIVPAPLRRAWSPKPSEKTVMLTQDDFKARQLQAQNRQETLYAAVRRLRVLAEPKIKAAKDHRVLLSDLGPDADRALANVLMIRAAPSLMVLMDANLPDYMLHPENIVLTGSYTVQEDGKKKASLFINIKNADGTISQRAGFF